MDENVVKTKTFLVQVSVRNNPVRVLNQEGKCIGSAVAGFVEGGLSVEVNLDRNTPEAFDVEVNPERVKLEVGALLDQNGFDVSIVLHT